MYACPSINLLKESFHKKMAAKDYKKKTTKFKRDYISAQLLPLKSVKCPSRYLRFNTRLRHFKLLLYSLPIYTSARIFLPYWESFCHSPGKHETLANCSSGCLNPPLCFSLNVLDAREAPDEKPTTHTQKQKCSEPPLALNKGVKRGSICTSRKMDFIRRH